MTKIDLDKSLDELDPIKMLLFFLAFVAISLFIIFIFIVPSVKEFKSVRVDYKRNEISTTRMKEVLVSKEEKLKSLLNENAHMLYALSNNFDEKKFLAYARRFFKQATISKATSTSYEKDYDIYELKVSSAINSPSKFYSFLDSLKEYENVIKADFPILMKEEKNDIYTTFSIKVYKYN